MTNRQNISGEPSGRMTMLADWQLNGQKKPEGNDRQEEQTAKKSVGQTTDDVRTDYMQTLG